jgi:hypothetical protein
MPMGGVVWRKKKSRSGVPLQLWKSFTAFYFTACSFTIFNAEPALNQAIWPSL